MMTPLRSLLAVGIASLCFGPASVAPAQAPALRPEFESFRMVRTRNVFDPDRRPGSGQARPAADAGAPRASFIAVTGTMVTPSRTLAFFSGSQSEYSKVIGVRGKVADFTVTRITPNEVEVERAGKTIAVAVGQRLPLDGSNAADPAPVVAAPGDASAAPPPATPGSTDSSFPAPTSDKAEQIRRMMERRQKEMGQ